MSGPATVAQLAACRPDWLRPLSRAVGRERQDKLWFRCGRKACSNDRGLRYISGTWVPCLQNLVDLPIAPHISFLHRSVGCTSARIVDSPFNWTQRQLWFTYSARHSAIPLQPASMGDQTAPEQATGDEPTRENMTMMQAFEWYVPADQKHWVRLEKQVPQLKAWGIDNMWIPPG
jgi:hypothetical protein